MWSISLEDVQLTGSDAFDKSIEWQRLIHQVEGAFSQGDDLALYETLRSLVRNRAWRAFNQSRTLIPLADVEAEMWEEVARCVSSYDQQPPMLLIRIARRFECKRGDLVRYVMRRRPVLETVSLDTIQKQSGNEPDDPEPGPEQQYELKELRTLVLALPEPERTCLLLSAQGLSLRAIAQRLCPERTPHPQTVRRILDRARKNVRKASGAQ